MRFPGGAVEPPMNAATGLRTSRRMNSAASSSAVPPISPIMMIAFVCGSFWKAARQSMKLVPGTGSPPIPTQVDWPRPREVTCQTAS